MRCSARSGSTRIASYFRASCRSGWRAAPRWRAPLRVEPELLLLDEPFVSLDDALAARLRDELAELVTRRPVTTLLVTHDVDEAIGLADRLFFLSASPTRVVAEIPVARPREKRTAEELAALRAEIARKLGQA